MKVVSGIPGGRSVPSPSPHSIPEVIVIRCLSEILHFHEVGSWPL
jgi:hypothetical protein